MSENLLQSFPIFESHALPHEPEVLDCDGFGLLGFGLTLQHRKSLAASRDCVGVTPKTAFCVVLAVFLTAMSTKLGHLCSAASKRPK